MAVIPATDEMQRRSFKSYTTAVLSAAHEWHTYNLEIYTSAVTSATDERQPCAGRYVHFWAADAGHAFLMGFGAYIGRDGQYAGTLQLKGREESLQLPADAESFQRMITAALPSLPRVRLPSRLAEI